MNRTTTILMSCLIVVSCIASILGYEKYEQVYGENQIQRLEQQVNSLETQLEQTQRQYTVSLTAATSAFLGAVHVNKRISSLIESLAKVLPAGAYIVPPDDLEEFDPRILLPEEMPELEHMQTPNLEPTPEEPTPATPPHEVEP
jgi:hypothetical protein